MAITSFKNIFFEPTSKKFVVSFSYNAALVNSLKAEIDFKFRKYDIQKKEWYVTLDGKESLERWARANGFNIASSAMQHFTANNASLRSFEIPDMPGLKIEIPLKMDPFPYQKVGMAYNIQNRGVMVGDVPGLGKTAQAIGSVTGLDLFPVLIICPNHLKINWREEWEMWTNKRAVLMTDRLATHPTHYFDSGLVHAVIVNYESLPKYFAKDMKRSEESKKVVEVELNGLEKHFKAIIWDESHECCNPKTIRYKISDKISKSDNLEMRLALTGTPIKNKLSELMYQLRLVDALKHFGGQKGFAQRYVGYERGKFGVKENPQNIEELQYMLRKHCYYRREKHEVLKDLPDKFRQVIKVEITNRAEYEHAEKNFVNYLTEMKKKTPEEIEKSLRAEIMVQMMHLIMISAKGKIQAASAFIKDMNVQEEKIVMFFHHREIHAALEAEFPNSVSIVGGMNIDDKDRSVKSFQNDAGTMNIFCSMMAAATGITLTASSKPCFIELPWTPDKIEQCEDRTHRIGQKDSVNAYYFVGEKTIDEKMYQIISQKRELAKKVTGADDRVETSVMGASDLFSDLIASFTKS
jgi:SWI/SNF-related matrix-associated actin-dependent regulator of chromatin subfamily A-like protein 1